MNAHEQYEVDKAMSEGRSKDALRIRAQAIIRECRADPQIKECLVHAKEFFAEGETRVEEIVQAIEGEVQGGYKVTRDSKGRVTPDTLALGIDTLGRALAARTRYIPD